MKTINTLVMSGGGVLGLSMCGVYKRLRELHNKNLINLDLKKVCGTSVGSIMGFVILLGYTPEELENEVFDKKTNSLLDYKISYFLKEYGFDSGNNMIGWLETLMLKKSVSKDITFIDFYKKTGIIYQAIATNLETYQYEIFDYITSPDMKITEAIRMSMSVPFVFTMPKYKDTIYSDGGLSCYYPIVTLTDEELKTTLGVRFGNNDIYKSPESEAAKLSETNKNIESGDTATAGRLKDVTLFEYLNKIVGSFNYHENLRIGKIYREYTIFVKFKKAINFVNFNLKRNDKKMLILSGYDSAKEYFESIELIAKNKNE